MKLSLTDRRLYTDAGELIKTLRCPVQLRQEDIGPGAHGGQSRCARCDHAVIDTDGRTDEEVVVMVRVDPATCLKVDLNQSNLRVVPRHGA